MSSVLPQGRLAPSKVNPKILMMYGPPKIGKTGKLSELESCLILDSEEGAEATSNVRIPVSSIEGGTRWDPDDPTKLLYTSLDQVARDLEAWGMEEYKKTGKLPRPPYTFIAMDTIDKFEDFCVISATRKYKDSIIGKTFEGETILDLPKGSGYYHLRNEVLHQIQRFAGYCEYLILVSHIKETLLNKGGFDVTVRDIALTGKLGSMVCALADVIAFVYREGSTQKQLMASFQTFDGTSVMGARFPRLAGKQIPFDWKNIYVPDGRSIPVGGPAVVVPPTE